MNKHVCSICYSKYACDEYVRDGKALGKATYYFSLVTLES